MAHSRTLCVIIVHYVQVLSDVLQMDQQIHVIDNFDKYNANMSFKNL